MVNISPINSNAKETVFCRFSGGRFGNNYISVGKNLILEFAEKNLLNLLVKEKQLNEELKKNICGS